MPYVRSGVWKVPSREGNPVIVVEHCAICGAFVPEPERVYQTRATGINGSRQRWTFDRQHAPREGTKVETSLVNRSMLVIDEW